MRVQVLAIVAAGVVAAVELPPPAAVRRIAWEDIAPVRSRLQAAGLTGEGFGAYVEGVHARNATRLREGDLDHLVFYLLQSTRFTSLPPIEPALSARALVERLDPPARKAFLADPPSAWPHVDSGVRARVAALIRALSSSSRDARLVYFRELVTATVPDRAKRDAALQREYLRVMRFVYEKEFVAQRTGPDAVAGLYRERGLSTDTAVEAGFVVYLGLGVVKSLRPDHRIRRVLIVGPGLDLAPRTGLLEAGPPESYQPWAVIDALVGLGLSRAGDLEVVGADINPRVVEHLRRARAAPPTLALVSGIRESPTLSFAAEYRDYFTQLGRAIGAAAEGAGREMQGHLRKTVLVTPAAARALTAETLDVVTERLDGPPFDLVVATNILPYFDDVGLMLAMTNVAAMLGPDGVFLHNEVRPLMQEVTTALGMPLEQSRHAIIANVTGAPAPLADRVWLHRKGVR